MRITNEADYALRIVYALLNCQQKNAKRISEESGVSLRFALKILRKLVQGGYVASHQGANGGYYLIKEPQEISVGNIVELIDGKVELVNCLNPGDQCSRMGCHSSACQLHSFLIGINHDLLTKLNAKTFDQFLPDTDSATKHNPGLKQ